MTDIAPSHELSIYLNAEGVGTLGATSGWAIYANKEPSRPDNVITIYDTGGSAPSSYEAKLLDPAIQVRVRSNNYANAYAKQNEIFNLFNNIIDQTIGASFYLGVWLSSDIISLGEDDNNRTILTANYQIKRGDNS